MIKKAFKIIVFLQTKTEFLNSKIQDNFLNFIKSFTNKDSSGISIESIFEDEFLKTNLSINNIIPDFNS